MIWALHGAFGDEKDWDALAESLGPDRLAAIDLWTDEYELPLRDWAFVFNRRVAAVDSAPVLLGYSMGARLGLHALIANPQLWKGAILVAPHPGLSDEHARLSRREHDNGWIEQFNDLPWSDFWQAWTTQPVLATHDPRPLLPERRARRRCLELWSLSEQDDLRLELGRIECPVQWVTGENDPKFTAIASGMTRLVPGSEQLTISGAGHRVPWDTPELFAELVDGFVTGLQVG